MNEQHMKEIFSDEAFVKSLFALETAEEVHAALKEKDVELSVEEINEIHDNLLKCVDENGELSLEQLENVAGGSVIVGVLGLATAVVGLASSINTSTRGRW